MHHIQVGQYVGYNWRNLEEFKELCAWYGVDFFQEKVYWEEEKVYEETKSEEQEGEEGSPEEEDRRKGKVFSLW